MPLEKDDEKITRIRNDVAYFKTQVLAAKALGHIAGTVYAEKYVEDVDLLLSLLDDVPGVTITVEPQTSVTTPVFHDGLSSLDMAITHDEAGRVERRPRSGR